MIVEICRVLICLAVGDLVSRFLLIPLPASVLGLLLLFVWLVRRGSVPPDLTALANRTLAMFGLLFVPAGVGVVAYKDNIRSDYIAIGLAISCGTLVTIALTGLVATWIARYYREDQKA